ncbi:FUSC family protein [Lutibacter sp. A80]|uniref:FUSC family protein n=1 Tax=Lutibacter sp. A80 TaxID=2918453 RepID=UPI001F05D9C1|nr:FUSC family membrane protein [Lutibacter sp. A80]UMB62003.1 FUSC family protein [Lutibacter sp. A80]
MFEKINRFIKSFSFLKAFVLAFSMLIPILISNAYFEDVSVGFSIALGVLFCSPTDVPGSLKHKFYGILSAIFLAFCFTFLFGSIAHINWILVPVLGVVIFLVSYLSVFGFRASLISFAGLMSIILSFAYDSSKMTLITHALLVALGGLWYLILSMSASLLLPKIQTDQLFVSLIEKTAAFLKVRGELLICKTNRDELYHKLFELQTQINDDHESIREIILSKRFNSGFSNRTRRQQLLFSELMEILELAVSNPVNYEEFDKVFKKHSEKIEAFKELTFELADQLEHISKVIRKEERLKPNTKIPEILNDIERHIKYYTILVGLPKARVGSLMLINLKHYQEKQVQSLIGIERVLGNYISNNKILDIKDANRFITPQDYDFKKIIENFSFKSPIFKHSLRLALIVIIGFLVGSFFSMQNPYWILITIVVIMRPSYGLTRKRSIQRVIGTLIGAAIATIIIFFTQSTTVYGVIAIVSLLLAFSMIQSNYRNAAIFITLEVVFVYAILDPNILSVIKFRIIDTLIGAGLAFSANYFLLPAWQFQNIQDYFKGAILANCNFLKQIDMYYHKKGEVPTVYKLSRKEAFLAIGNLNAAFQRMSQDPKSKQKEYANIYKLITLNNTFLSSLTALGMFIRNNKTTVVPVHFEVIVNHIIAKLKLAVELLDDKESVIDIKHSEVEIAQKKYEDYFKNLSNQSDKELEEGLEISDKMRAQLKETQLVSEQINWLFNLSGKLISSIKQYKSNSLN